MSKPKLTWTTDGLNAVSAAIPSVRELGRDDIKVAYQPIVDLDTGRTFAHEALVRCQKPGLESPLTLFSRACEEEACGRLGRLIREVAFFGCSTMPLFVNVHPDELSSRWLIQPDDPLGFHAPPVYLEVTEAAAFTHFDLCSSVLKELCTRAGIHLVVDDFGAGYSNIQRILDLEPAVVKLDLALVRNIEHKPRKQSVVKHMVALCEDLGCKVVAEGIESVDELSAVRDLGVHFGQGYLLAKPAFAPPEVHWPAEVRLSTRRAGAPRVSLEPRGSKQPAITVPAGPLKTRPAGSRILVEEVVFISRSEELHPRSRAGVEPAKAPARKKSASKLPPPRSEAPTQRPSAPSGRPARSTTSPDARATRRPGRKSTSNRPGRRSKAPPR